MDFLNNFPKKLAEYESLVTLDVSNMYTNIDNALGLYAINTGYNNIQL